MKKEITMTNVELLGIIQGLNEFQQSGSKVSAIAMMAIIKNIKSINAEADAYNKTLAEMQKMYPGDMVKLRAEMKPVLEQEVKLSIETFNIDSIKDAQVNPLMWAALEIMLEDE